MEAQRAAEEAHRVSGDGRKVNLRASDKRGIAYYSRVYYLQHMTVCFPMC